MSSSWRRDPTTDALLSRQARSSAVAGGRGPIADRPQVPKWLIEKQQEFVRQAGSQEPAPQMHTPTKRQQEKKKAPEPDPTVDDDLIMVDLLDGAHLQTRPSAQQDRISTNSDSIISLPPIDDGAATKSWQSLKSQNQDLRRLQRGGASIGVVPPNYLRAGRSYNPPTNSPAQQRTRSKHEVLIPIIEPLPPNTKPKNLVETGPSLRANAMNASQTAPGRHTAANPVKPGTREQETTPILAPEAVTWRSHSRQDSLSVRDGNNFCEDDFSWSTSSQSNPSLLGKRPHGRQKEHFQPGIWGWRKPAEEDAIMPRGAWVYLPLIGVFTFLTAYSVNAAANFLSVHCISSAAAFVQDTLGNRPGLVALASLRGLALVVSFLLILFIAPDYTMGSGIPEMKCVMSGVLMPRMLNWKTLVAKTSGLAFALSSAISIGRLGPFIHISGIIAALVSKIPFFTSLHSSARFQLQALSAAMAAGVGATFGAPIGGTMLSIELMSTYYYIHWLPMALYCSIMGYYCVVTIVQSEEHAFFKSNVTVDLKLEPLQRLFTYVILGVLCGLVGAALVQFTKRAFMFRKKRFTCSRPIRTAVMLFVFAVAHTLVAIWVGGVMTLRQRDGVIQLINSTQEDELWVMKGWKPFSYSHWNSSVMLLCAVAVKFLLTGLSLVMPVPAGTFMPIFELGALLGRAFGELCSGFSFVNWVDPRATAIIGAAAVTTGTLHTTSVAVVMLELTREAIDILPLTVGVIVAYAVSAHITADLFSELIKIRRLPFVLGLRERYPSENNQFYEDASTVVAGSFMSKTFPYVTPQTTKGEILKLLRKKMKPWSFCAFLSDTERRRLWGTISQQALWDIVSEESSVLPGESVDDTYGTFNREFNRTAWESETVPFLKDFNPSVGHPLVDMGPMLLPLGTPFWKVLRIFRMLSMTQVFVVQDGATVGTITRTQVIQHSHTIEERAERKRERLREKELQKQKIRQDVIDHLRRHPPSSKRLTSQPSGSDLSGLVVSRSRSRHGSFSRVDV